MKDVGTYPFQNNKLVAHLANCVLLDYIDKYNNHHTVLKLLFILFAAGDSQESGSPPPSPTDSATSESAPTLVHIKQETMPPGVDVKDYYSTLDYGLSDTYLSPHFSEYGRGYLPNRYDSKSPKEKIKGGKDDEILENDLNLPIELVLKNGGVFARVNIPSGTKYGPFIGKWETQPLDTRYAWEVSVLISDDKAPFLASR